MSQSLFSHTFMDPLIELQRAFDAIIHETQHTRISGLDMLALNRLLPVIRAMDAIHRAYQVNETILQSQRHMESAWPFQVAPGSSLPPLPRIVYDSMILSNMLEFRRRALMNANFYGPIRRGNFHMLKLRELEAENPFWG